MEFRMRKMNFYRKLLKKYFKYCQRRSKRAARAYLRRNRDLNDLINEVNKQSASKGLSNFEYVRLYQMLRNVKPEYALECGTGKSTFIIAHAMSKNGNGKKLVTMEESEQWASKQEELISYFFNHKKVSDWFPDETKDLVELNRSAVIVESYRIWSGSSYKSIIDYPYTFIMVDGPKHTNEKFLNLDLINILRTSDNPISLWIDGRWPTVAMCGALFGEKVISKPGWTHSEIYGATPEDLFKDRGLIAKEILRMLKGE